MLFLSRRRQEIYTIFMLKKGKSCNSHEFGLTRCIIGLLDAGFTTVQINKLNFIFVYQLTEFNCTEIIL